MAENFGEKSEKFRQKSQKFRQNSQPLVINGLANRYELHSEN